MFLSKCPGAIPSFSLISSCISKKHRSSISSQKQFRCPCQATWGTRTLLTVAFLKVRSPSTFSIICKALQSEKWSQSTLQVPQSENLNMGRSWEAAGNSGLLRWREQEGRRHKCSFSLVGCDGDPQTHSALCLTAFSWVTWELHFQMRAVENLGDKSQRWDYLEQVFPRGSLVFWIATMGPLCQPWCSSSCPRLIIGITGVLKS